MTTEVGAIYENRRTGECMEYFCLDHPSDQPILCGRSDCGSIADYLEVNEHGDQEFACATHTRSVRHALVLPTALPSDKHRGNREAA